MTEHDLKAIKADAKRDFGKVPGVEGFGIGAGTLRIYILNNEVASKLPADRRYKGVPIELVVTGPITAGV
jgi:hypothetical protein